MTDESDDAIARATIAVALYGSIRAAARETNTPYTTMHRQYRRAAERGLLGTNRPRCATKPGASFASS
jgi:hypothetical protein